MIPSFTYLDRYRNEGTRTYSLHSDYTEADERYRPTAIHQGFELPAFLIPSQETEIYAANPSPAIRASYLRGDAVLFCIHPQVLERQREDPYVQRTLALGRPGAPIPVTVHAGTMDLHDQHSCESIHDQSIMLQHPVDVVTV